MLAAKASGSRLIAWSSSFCLSCSVETLVPEGACGGLVSLFWAMSCELSVTSSWSTPISERSGKTSPNAGTRWATGTAAVPALAAPGCGSMRSKSAKRWPMSSSMPCRPTICAIVCVWMFCTVTGPAVLMTTARLSSSTGSANSRISSSSLARRAVYSLGSRTWLGSPFCRTVRCKRDVPRLCGKL